MTPGAKAMLERLRKYAHPRIKQSPPVPCEHCDKNAVMWELTTGEPAKGMTREDSIYPIEPVCSDHRRRPCPLGPNCPLCAEIEAMNLKTELR